MAAAAAAAMGGYIGGYVWEHIKCAWWSRWFLDVCRMFVCTVCIRLGILEPHKMRKLRAYGVWEHG